MGMKELQGNSIRLPTPSQVDRVRYPDELFTDGYLDDPIRFAVDDRFQPRTVVGQLDVLPDQVERDYGRGLKVDVNGTDPQYFAINLYSPVWNRQSYLKIINTKRRSFTQLIRSDA